MNAIPAPVMGESDFRLYLQAELVRRCKDNPKYSLRAFARTLEVEPSALSKIMAGKRKLSTTMFDRLARRLALDPERCLRFKARLHGVEWITRGELHSLGGTLPPNPAEAVQYNRVNLEVFQVIAEWYHFAILELTRVEHFRSDKRWVARTLGISVAEVTVAVERLKRLNLLHIENDRWVDKSENLSTVGNEFTATAFRLMQRQLLSKAIQAMEDVPMDSRDQSSLTFAANSRLLPEAKARIRAFRRSMNRFLQSEGPYDAVMNLSVSLFPLSNTTRGARK